MRRPALRSGLEGARGFLSDCGATVRFEPAPNLFSRGRAEAQSVARAADGCRGGGTMDSQEACMDSSAWLPGVFPTCAQKCREIRARSWAGPPREATGTLQNPLLAARIVRIRGAANTMTAAIGSTPLTRACIGGTAARLDGETHV